MRANIVVTTVVCIFGFTERVVPDVCRPQYFLVILGIWKLLGAVALVIPRFPRLKEWAYAGVLFDFDGSCCIFSGLGVDGCGYAGISDHNDGSCSCVVGAPSTIPPPWSRLS